ncbi:unnamed protein product [Mytilus edulis]|uniref:Uncharacterized protein n=1 Tax=Mytilus edulis TaxID=6550 RepID=A0A8S3PN93_MYTED|nr:unnamed protein product [Mytilus edulis]
MILEVLAAYEVLKNHDGRAEYNNKADYTKGCLSTDRWRAIFWPECKTEEQILRYRKRMVMLLMSLGIGIGGVVSGTLMAACLGGCFQSSFRITNGQSIEKGCDFKDWAKGLSIGLVAGAITAPGGGVVFFLANDAEKKYVDGVDVTLTQAVGHAIAGACIWGINVAVVGEVAAGYTGMYANVYSTEIAGQLAPSLLSGISSEVYIDLSLTNKVSESVLGTVAGLIEERLDDKQKNRPISEHVTHHGQQFIKSLIIDLGSGVVSDVVDQVKNQNNETFSHVDRSDRGSHLEHFYGVSGTDHSSSIKSTYPDLESN